MSPTVDRFLKGLAACGVMVALAGVACAHVDRFNVHTAYALMYGGVTVVLLTLAPYVRQVAGNRASRNTTTWKKVVVTSTYALSLVAISLMWLYLA